jgi:hypothetical protein
VELRRPRFFLLAVSAFSPCGGRPLGLHRNSRRSERRILESGGSPRLCDCRSLAHRQPERAEHGNVRRSLQSSAQCAQQALWPSRKSNTILHSRFAFEHPPYNPYPSHPCRNIPSFVFNLLRILPFLVYTNVSPSPFAACALFAKKTGGPPSHRISQTETHRIRSELSTFHIEL